MDAVGGVFGNPWEGKKEEEKNMEEAARKLMEGADEEITRICGGETEYLTWLGKSAAVITSSMAAYRKLVDDAEAQKRPFSEKEKLELKSLEWIGALATLVGAQIETLSHAVNPIIAKFLPLPVLEPVVGAYVAAHRLGHALWRNSDELRLLSRPADPKAN
jgi:hypothetical protein